MTGSLLSNLCMGHVVTEVHSLKYNLRLAVCQSTPPKTSLFFYSARLKHFNPFWFIWHLIFPCMVLYKHPCCSSILSPYSTHQLFGGSSPFLSVPDLSPCGALISWPCPFSVVILSCLILEAWLPLFNYPPDGIQIRPLAWKQIFPRSWAGEWAGSPWNSDPETPVLLFPLSVMECRDQDSLPWLLRPVLPAESFMFLEDTNKKMCCLFFRVMLKGKPHICWKPNARV